MRVVLIPLVSTEERVVHLVSCVWWVRAALDVQYVVGGARTFIPSKKHGTLHSQRGYANLHDSSGA